MNLPQHAPFRPLKMAFPWRLFGALFALCWSGLTLAQHRYPQNDFRSPVDIPIYLAGNFGELRPNHFHAGLDIKTEGREGKRIYAIADGYVSRIKISTRGYGKALYITHPNGYTSVYAHLQRFSPEIEAYVRKEQYRQQTFTLELFPTEVDLPVKQSDVVALSGNTGSSGGPHLHFEIRETYTEVPVNPLLFGYAVPDRVPPVIKMVSVYPLDDTSTVNGRHVPQHFRAQGGPGSYSINGRGAIKVHGRIGFGIETIDRMSGSSNQNGTYSVELYREGALIYHHEMEKVGFHETRYLNSHVDYYQSWRNRRKIQRSFLLPNNPLGIYRTVPHAHALPNDPDTVIAMKYVVKDVLGNESALRFRLRVDTTTANGTASAGKGMRFDFDRENRLQHGAMEAYFPAGSFYRDVDFQFSERPPVTGAVCPTYRLHRTHEPLHKAMTLNIRLNDLPERLLDKALIVSVNGNGKPSSRGGGTLDGRQLQLKTTYLGNYTVMIDSVAPAITPLNISPGKSVQGQSTIAFKIKDRLAGISEYNCWVDGQWVLMEYETKKHTISHALADSPIGPGVHNLKLEVVDGRGNRSVYTADFRL
ncbi:MAG: M23 family metallopeptidase [Bacteroidota bacterium]